MKKSAFLFLLVTLFYSCSSSDENEQESQQKEYSPYVGDYTPQPLPKGLEQPFFGDSHLHTSWSVDAGMLGTTLGPEEAYRAARGEEVTTATGQKFRLIRPLDWVVIADHAENLGLYDFIERSDPELLKTEKGKRWHDMVKNGQTYEAYFEWASSINTDQINNTDMVRSAWGQVADNADKYNDPGKFTAFAGYEYSTAPEDNNLHRVVIFKDGADKTKQVIPFSAFDSANPEDLWKYMANYEKNTGGRVLGIPHNGNLSNGLMFDTETFDGSPITKEWAEERMRFEPLYEVVQIKGDGEAHPLLSPDDEFADYETLDKGNILASKGKTPDMLPKEYARAAYKEGIKQAARIGANPYKFGMIGSSDAHGSVPTTREENFFHKGVFLEPNIQRHELEMVTGSDPDLTLMARDMAAAGLAAIWAPENTREALFDAMIRKEVYATTGTRIVVRVFGGYGFSENDLGENFALKGYEKGVPMGGDIVSDNGRQPGFIIKAHKDPDGANLDRIQMVKGWLDEDGETHEKVFDLAVSDNRVINSEGICTTPVGSTVDVGNASYTNDIGAVELNTFWKDPDFDASQNAFYYVRVIEIPTPRWPAYDAKFFNIKMGDEVQMTTQDRAYTSPIWYLPD